MKKLSFFGALLAALTFSASVMAQDMPITTDTGASDGTFKPMVAGAFMSMGMADFVGDNGDAKPRFAGGAGAYFDYYLKPILALEAGIGFLGTGFRIENGDVTTRCKFTNMEIPLGVKLNFKGFQASAALALHFVLAGKVKVKGGGLDGDASITDWADQHRANIAPRLNVGYAIPIGPVALVPSVTWFINLVKENKESNNDVRAMNLMFNVGAEFGFGG